MKTIEEFPDNVSSLVIQLVIAAHEAGIDRAELLAIVRDAQDTHAELEADLEDDEQSPSPRTDALLAQARELGHEVKFINCGTLFPEDLTGLPVVYAQPSPRAYVRAAELEAKLREQEVIVSCGDR